MYGSDLAGVEDLDFALTFLEGDAAEKRALVQAVTRRYLGPRGSLFYARSYGWDLRTLLADTLPAAVAESAIAAEARKDERIRTATATVTDDGDGTRNVTIDVTPVDSGPFRLTFSLTAEGIALL